MLHSQLRIVTTGLIAQYPLGGVAWDYLQYAIGLKQLGHDVYYIEDTGQWPYDPSQGGVSDGCANNVEFLSRLMARFGLQDRWAYKFPWQSRWYGMERTQREEVLRSADLLLNVSGSFSQLRDYDRLPRLVFIDSDPVFTQVKIARGQRDFKAFVDAHDVHFTFGESMGEAVPDTGHRWIPTRQPVVLDEWSGQNAQRSVFTTIMNWSSYKPVEYSGTRYEQKDVEFMRFVHLPEMVAPATLELALNAVGKFSKAPLWRLRQSGWAVVDPAEVCPDPESYRRYIQSSMAEWSVAKGGYVIGPSGWFSCRSACYLAAGRPVVLQDTGFSKVLPVGRGILAFSNQEEAAFMIGEVTRNYRLHAEAASAIASSYFDCRQVLSRMIEVSLSSSQEDSVEARC